MCFPDGSDCHATLLMNGLCGQENTYCAQQGYQVEISKGGSVPLTCVFPDGSICSEVEYLLGECEPGENIL